jgi:hypothetical protein
MKRKNTILAICVSTVVLVLSAIGIALLANGRTYNAPLPTMIELGQQNIDLGNLQKDCPKKVAIPFRNAGPNLLAIAEVTTSCGCTEALWPKYPVKPGATDTVWVTYDAKHIGRFAKTVTLMGNFDMAEIVIIGEVNETSHE